VNLSLTQTKTVFYLYLVMSSFETICTPLMGVLNVCVKGVHMIDWLISAIW